MRNENQDYSFESFLLQLQSLKARQLPCVVVTLTHIEGSAPQNLGARMIVSEEGLIFGTIGGGKIEAKALVKAQEILQSQSSGQPGKESYRWNLQKDIGMSCGGAVVLLFEHFSIRADWNIMVFGAGHVAQALVPLLLLLESQIFCWDSRPEWLAKLPTHPRLKILKAASSTEAVAELPENTYVVVMTMGHTSDLPILKEIFRTRNFPYVGCMGSEVKARKLRAELLASGSSQALIDSLRCPIGERMGNNSPVEIAFSVVTELIKTRDQRQMKFFASEDQEKEEPSSAR